MLPSFIGRSGIGRKPRFNKPMDLEALAYIHACLSATLKMTRRSCGDLKKMINLIDYFI